jgi:glycosyltransferase involved in cell wall biosynthesis
VFTRRDDPSLPDVVDFAPGVRVIHVTAGPPEPVPKEALMPFMARFAERMRPWVRRERYDLAHAHFFMSGMVAMQLRRELGLPFLITFHALGKVRRRFQGANDGFPDDRFAAEEQIVRAADTIVAECPVDRDDLIELYRADPRRVTIVPCGVDLSEFQARDQLQARRELGLDPNEPLLLQLGRLVPRKGVDDVIRATAVLRRADVPARLLVVGGSERDPDASDDPELARLQDIAWSEGIAPDVEFVGRRDRDELEAWYNAADVFVTAPWYEPFGITPLESMACGTPVIGSKVGGIGYTIRDGETGFLVPPRSPDAIADRARRLLGDRSMRCAMGQEARRWVAARFTWARVASELLAAYERVLGPVDGVSWRLRHAQPGPRPAAARH